MAQRKVKEAVRTERTPPVSVRMMTMLRECERAAEEGRLQACIEQSVGSSYRDGDGNPCAVGAGLTDAQIEQMARRRKEMGNTSRINDLHLATLMADGVFMVEEGFVAMRELCALQKAHDRVQEAKRRVYDTGGATAVAKEFAEFRKLLAALIAKYRNTEPGDKTAVA